MLPLRPGEDLGEPSQLCQMCGGVDVRYVHHMQHRDYPNVLAVGFVCAEHTEEDYAGPRRREEHLKSAARRRASWARLGWKLSRKRNFYLNAEGFNFTIFRNGPRYKVAVKNRETDQSRLGDQVYDPLDAAKMGALDELLLAKEDLR